MLEQLEPSANPFPGLRPFETEEYDRFFGRDGQSEELVNKLRINRFVAVVGTSGSGKSSLVRAGLLPALYSGHMRKAGSCWRIAIFRPQDNPIRNLALALSDEEVVGQSEAETAITTLTNIETTLRRSSLGLIEVTRQARMLPQENLLIVVDQFEELFRFKQASTDGSTGDEKAAFVKLLLEAIKQDEMPIYIALTMRSDYLGDCAQFRDLPEAINRSQYLIPRMTDDERREAITGPIKVGGGEITSPLVNRLLNDVGDNPDQLPILQHAMMRTWECWSLTRTASEPIDLPHYEEIGGMTRALSLDADKAYEELSESRKKIAEKLFKRLTEKGADNREVRRPTRVEEICAVTGENEREVFAVIEAFQSERRCFLTVQDSVIDISHESLIRGWNRLKVWVEAEAQSARIYRRLAESAVEHSNKRAALLMDPELQFALDWYERERPNETWAERYHTEFEKAVAYLEESKAAREAAAAEKERREREEIEREQRIAEIERQRARRLRRLVTALIVMFLVAMGTAIYAGLQTVRANQQANIAESETERAKEQTKRAEEQKELAESATRKEEIAKNEAEGKTEDLNKAYADLKKVLLERDQQRQRAEQKAREVVQATLLGNLYLAVHSHPRNGTAEDYKKYLEGLEAILKIYEDSNAREGQIATLRELWASNDEQPLPGEKKIEYGKKLASFLGDKDKSKKVDLLLDIADTARRLGNKDQEAIDIYEEVLSLKVSDFKKHESALKELATLYTQSKDKANKAKAIEKNKEKIDLIKNELLSTKDEAERGSLLFTLKSSLKDIARSYLAVGNERDAEKLYKEVIKTDGNEDKSSLYRMMALGYQGLNDTRKAGEYYDKALEAAGNSSNISKARAAYNEGKVNAQAATLTDASTLWYYERALEYSRMTDDTELRAMILGDIGATNYGLQETYGLQKNEESIKAYNEQLTLLRSDESKAEVLIHIAWCYHYLNKGETALNYLEKALKIYKDLVTEGRKDLKAKVGSVEEYIKFFNNKPQ